MDKKIFISYSRMDQSFVNPVVRLLRVTNDYVFFDVDSINPGKKWRETLNDAISESNLFVLFWCRHSSSSEEVTKEYTTAIESEKDIIPVLLDSTPLPEKLREYQWLDFRNFGKANHSLSLPDMIFSRKKEEKSDRKETLDEWFNRKFGQLFQDNEEDSVEKQIKFSKRSTRIAESISKEIHQRLK